MAGGRRGASESSCGVGSSGYTAQWILVLAGTLFRFSLILLLSLSVLSPLLGEVSGVLV